MEKLPTAREFREQFEKERPILAAFTKTDEEANSFYLSAQGAMTIDMLLVEHTKLHVKAAVEAIKKNIKYTSMITTSKTGEQKCEVIIESSSIIDAYPLENIK